MNVLKIPFEQHALKKLNNFWNTNIYSYSEISGGQSYNVYLIIVNFFNASVFRHLWQLKTVVFLHWCLIHANVYYYNNI